MLHCKWLDVLLVQVMLYETTDTISCCRDQYHGYYATISFPQKKTLLLFQPQIIVLKNWLSGILFDLLKCFI